MECQQVLNFGPRPPWAAHPQKSFFPNFPKILGNGASFSSALYGDPQGPPGIKAAKTTSGTGLRPYSCSPPSTWSFKGKISKNFQGHFFEIFGVKVERFKNYLNELQEFFRGTFLRYLGSKLKTSKII